MDRVDGSLALSRAFGDYNFKENTEKKPEEQAVTAFPDVKEVERGQKDQMVVVACDGIWDCVSNDECAKKINKTMKETKDKEGTDLSTPLVQLFDSILADKPLAQAGTDNMTAIIVKFKS